MTDPSTVSSFTSTYNAILNILTGKGKKNQFYFPQNSKNILINLFGSRRYKPFEARIR